MTAENLAGRHLVAGEHSNDAVDWFETVDPRTGQVLEPSFPEATPDVIERACAAAAEASPTFSAANDRRVQLLRAIADRLDARAASVVEVADRESGLGTSRLTGELARTIGQLRLFADLVADGSYQRVVIDHADPDATPPRPDLRRRLVALGPVAVFGAGNFPLAFSVAGGDTASALAAGCPVVVKGHPAHPFTSLLVGQAIAEIVAESELPAGVFSLVHGRTPDVGGMLVSHPAIKAVGFTGSAAAGQALFRRGALREEPIPVFAEMGSLNPVVVSPEAAVARPEVIADGFVASMTLGGGQFCTKPGLLFVPVGEAGDRLAAAVADGISSFEPGVLLTPGIRDACASLTSQTAALPGVNELARTRAAADGVRTDAVLLGTDAATLMDDPQLLEEHFGPTSILVRYADAAELEAAVAVCPGSLTASVFAQPDELPEIASLLTTLDARAGRLVFDGFPTGVAVAHGMQHGGPYPATTDTRFTSVGTAAIDRWLRPVTYQDSPTQLLPAVLADGNPLGVWRLVDGVRTNEA